MNGPIDKRGLHALTGYAKLWTGLVQPAFETVRGKITPRIEKRLAESQWSSLAELQDRQWQEFDVLLKYAVSHVSPLNTQTAPLHQVIDYDGNCSGNESGSGIDHEHRAETGEGTQQR